MNPKAQQIFQEALATLERTAHLAAQSASRDLPDALEEWTRTMPQPTRPPHRAAPEPEPAPRQEQDWSAWNKWADGRVKRALAKERDFQREVLGAALAAIRKQLCEEFDAQITEDLKSMRQEFAALRVELAAMRTGLAEIREQSRRLDAISRGQDAERNIDALLQ